ncbi:RDD family protein [Paenochrobactrum pullorum]|uniref:RDD family protein n=1 Tax=Paenochrobactrum pullorum TaxID=1324351 RepID=UPI0035BC0BA0
MSYQTYTNDMQGAQLTDYRLFDGVRTRRIFAFLIDYAIIFMLTIPAAIIIAILGVLTLGLGWMLYAIIFPLVALSYIAFTMGGEQQATLGMRAMNIRLMRLDGLRVDSMLAIVHSILFWALNTVLTPLILFASLFLDRKRTLHDLLLGTVVVRSDRLDRR